MLEHDPDRRKDSAAASACAAAVANPGSPVRVLVVVPSLDEAAHIEAVLTGLLEDTADLPGVTIVAADGGSRDATPHLVRALAQDNPKLKLLENPARIQSAGVNAALRRFGQDADVLIRCDAHSFYPKGYCRKLIETLRRTGAHSVVVPLDSRGDSPLQRAVAWLSDSPLGNGGSAHRGGRKSGFVDHGHHAAFKADTFRAAGGYDESFTHNEDAEFDCRQRALGARIYLDSEIRVGYRPRSSLGALWTQYFRYGAGRSRTARRHPGSLRLRQLAVPAHLVLSLLALAVSPWSKLLLAWPALYLAITSVVALQLSLRHRSGYGLLAAPAAVTMHTAWALGFWSGFVRTRERIWSRDMAVPLWLEANSREPT